PTCGTTPVIIGHRWGSPTRAAKVGPGGGRAALNAEVALSWAISWGVIAFAAGAVSAIAGSPLGCAGWAHPARTVVSPLTLVVSPRSTPVLPGRAGRLRPV